MLSPTMSSRCYCGSTPSASALFRISTIAAAPRESADARNQWHKLVSLLLHLHPPLDLVEKHVLTQRPPLLKWTRTTSVDSIVLSMPTRYLKKPAGFNRVGDLQEPIENLENINRERYAGGAVYALQNCLYDLTKVCQSSLWYQQMNARNANNTG